MTTATACYALDDDERIALADLPLVPEGFRASLLQRDAKSLREQHRIMLDALRLIALGNDDSARIARAAMVRASFE